MMMFIQDVFFTEQLLTAVNLNMMMFIQDAFFTKQLLTAVNSTI